MATPKNVETPAAQSKRHMRALDRMLRKQIAFNARLHAQAVRANVMLRKQLKRTRSELKRAFSPLKRARSKRQKRCPR